MKYLKLSLLLISSIAFTSLTRASDYDFSGTFTKDNEVVSLSFTVGASSNITIFSSSWITGGFDPILAIWDSAGNKVSEQDDGHVIGSTLSNGISYNTGNWDSYYSVLLSAGTYTATIGQYNNFANGSNLSAGFLYDGPANDHFTTAFGPQANFNGVLNGNDARNGNWAFHILNAAEAHQENRVPDAASTVALLGLGLVAVSGLRRRLQN